MSNNIESSKRISISETECIIFDFEKLPILNFVQKIFFQTEQNKFILVHLTFAFWSDLLILNLAQENGKYKNPC